MAKNADKTLSLRQHVLDDKAEFRTKTVPIQIAREELQVEFREPSQKLRGKIMNKAQTIIQRNQEQQIIIDSTAMHVYAVIYLAHDPSTGQRIFTEMDFDTLASRPRSWLDRWVKPALEMMGEEDQEDAEKN